jgi:hypothetical protein
LFIESYYLAFSSGWHELNDVSLIYFINMPKLASENSQVDSASMLKLPTEI